MIDNSMMSIDEDDLKMNFFDAVKSEKNFEIAKYFRNEDIKVWLWREEEDYTGK
jgi:hypothetical protein